jgi:hypothetical protein
MSHTALQGPRYSIAPWTDPQIRKQSPRVGEGMESLYAAKNSMHPNKNSSRNCRVPKRLHLEPFPFIFQYTKISYFLFLAFWYMHTKGSPQKSKVKDVVWNKKKKNLLEKRPSLGLGT